ncbi:MAG: MBL fold metallo-hydrolase [Bacteroidetes bacterium]|nr:MBL fold metallo-hydrolase [Bacteroidota bacterium]
MIIALTLILVFIIAVYGFMQQKSFGKRPNGERFNRIKASPNYKNGAFHNISFTPVMVKEANFFKILFSFFINPNKKKFPHSPIPTAKTDLLNLDLTEDDLVWFGHSSYFIQLDGKKILVDPVMSGSVSPLRFTNKAFKGSDVYTTDDIPAIDYLFITHDHWDHLDYSSIIKLKNKISRIICPLGVGEHLEYWGFESKNIFEMDWHEELKLQDDFNIFSVPARHFSGRNFKRNQSLWSAFVIETPAFKLYLGGDGGYDSHFKAAADKFGGFDLAILENGQYNPNWRFIHCLPEQVIQAAKDLNAKRILPVHSSKFKLALHDWDEPLNKISELIINENIGLVTPMIGEKVNLKDSTHVFSQWWKELNQA